MPPPRTVTPLQLTLLMLTLVVVPITCGVALYWMSPVVEEPKLAAKIKLSSVWIEDDVAEPIQAAGTEEAKRVVNRRLVQCIVVRNESDLTFGKLSIGINDQFFSTGNKSIPPGEEVSIPLESFIARNGSVRFPVGNRPIRKATVFAQLGTGARGVSEFLFTESEEWGPTEWKDPSHK